jgi:hypothetical protein
LLDGTVADGNHGGASHLKGICHDLALELLHRHGH